MSKNQILIFLLVLACTFSSCEKDDLCIPEELDIPRLVVVFVDARNQLLRKPVQQLQVIDSSSNMAVALNDEGATSLTQVDSVSIPLRRDLNSPLYNFVRTLETVENRDGISLTYEPEEVYLNRACGFTSIYNNLTADVIEEPQEQNWISTVIVRTPNVTSSNQDIHVEIRH